MKRIKKEWLKRCILMLEERVSKIESKIDKKKEDHKEKILEKLANKFIEFLDTTIEREKSFSTSMHPININSLIPNKKKKEK